MIITALPPKGNSSKFHVDSKNGEFDLAISYTLRMKIWKLVDAETELAAAETLAEAVVSRHNTAFPFKPLYIFAEHNTLPTLEQTVQQLRKTGF
jgi:hypothetical protein